MMEVAGFSKTLVQTYQTTRHYVVKDPSVCTYRQRNYASHVVKCY